MIETGLRMLHPMMVYVTEELYQKLPTWEGKIESISIAKYPEGNEAHIFEGVDQFDKVIEVIGDIRKILGTVNLPPKSNPPVYIGVTGENNLIADFAEFISALSKVGEIKVLAAGEEAPKGCMSVLSAGTFTVNVEIFKFIKIEDEIKKIMKSIAEKQKPIDTLKKKLSAKDYETKVPEDVRIKEKEKLELYEAEIKTLQTNVDTFQKML